jgi:hypothetical protein
MTRHIPPRSKKEPDVKHLPSNTDKYKYNHLDRISFSFHYLNLNHAKFSVNDKTTHYFRKLIDRLKDISSIEKIQLTGYGNKTLRCHPIK